MMMKAADGATTNISTHNASRFGSNSRLGAVPRSLIVGGLRPDYEMIVEEQLGCLHQALWLRCENGLLWDPYGSFMRTMLISLKRYPQIRTIYVVAESRDRQDAPAQDAELIDLSAKLSQDTGNTIRFLLQQYYGIDPEEWLRSDDSKASVYIRDTLRVIREHPLLPRDITVRGFLIKEPGILFHPVGE
ncbi:MAG: hypothetical protein C7B43_08070 [Sulfobacillus benefaciens]|uniref:Uncharacterized protein n=1 Tax=Sulfobacillus benefaciens TaxID=453960 RepID=A0A2T2X547_9FIRM|nr:MAG: hypothetical protein C7B43_08070 [Sulfobacillus benefaciens]